MTAQAKTSASNALSSPPIRNRDINRAAVALLGALISPAVGDPADTYRRRVKALSLCRGFDQAEVVRAVAQRICHEIGKPEALADCEHAIWCDAFCALSWCDLRLLPCDGSA